MVKDYRWSCAVILAAFQVCGEVRAQQAADPPMSPSVEEAPLPAGSSEAPLSPIDFTLVKGSDNAVCVAYAARLNHTDFGQQVGPHCGRPESATVEGFAELKRVVLSFDDIYAIGDRLLSFYRHNDQDWEDREAERELSVCDKPRMEALCKERQQRKQSAEARGARWHSYLSEMALREGKAIAWRYDPAVDLDNDGRPDPLLLYRERCDGVQLGATFAFVMDPAYQRVDEALTRQMFGHPNPKRAGHLDSGDFRAIGDVFGVFEYRGQFYFDTFFPDTGDFEDRRGEEPSLGSFLGVFHRKDGRTRQVCEIRWNGSYDSG